MFDCVRANSMQRKMSIRFIKNAVMWAGGRASFMHETWECLLFLRTIQGDPPRKGRILEVILWSKEI